MLATCVLYWEQHFIKYPTEIYVIKVKFEWITHKFIVSFTPFIFILQNWKSWHFGWLSSWKRCPLFIARISAVHSIVC